MTNFDFQLVETRADAYILSIKLVHEDDDDDDYDDNDDNDDDALC